MRKPDHLAGRWAVSKASIAVLAMTAALGVGACDRSETEPGAVSDRADESAEEIRKLLGAWGRSGVEVTPGGPEVLPTDVSRRLGPYVHKRIKANEAVGLASLILAEGPRQESPWYDDLAYHFARAFAIQDRPISLADADTVILALTKLCGTRYSRDTRVYAAVAIRFDVPEKARTVLEQTYADAQLPVSGGPRWAAALGRGIPAAGPYLSSMGVAVPRECTSITDVAQLLSSAGRPCDLRNPKERQILGEVGNQLNGVLRRKIESGDYASLEQLESAPEFLWDLVRAIRDDLDTHPEIQGHPQRSPVRPATGG